MVWHINIYIRHSCIWIGCQSVQLSLDQSCFANWWYSVIFDWPPVCAYRCWKIDTIDCLDIKWGKSSLHSCPLDCFLIFRNLWLFTWLFKSTQYREPSLKANQALKCYHPVFSPEFRQHHSSWGLSCSFLNYHTLNRYWWEWRLCRMLPLEIRRVLAYEEFV